MNAVDVAGTSVHTLKRGHSSCIFYSVSLYKLFIEYFHIVLFVCLLFASKAIHISYHVILRKQIMKEVQAEEDETVVVGHLNKLKVQSCEHPVL